MPKFIHDSSDAGTPMSGTYDYRGGTFQVPSGANPPAPTLGSQIFFVPNSGVLLVASGSTWASFALTSTYSPSQISNLVFWGDAQAESYTQGQLINTFTNQSTDPLAGADLAPAASGDAPGFETAGINSYAAIGFSGSHVLRGDDYVGMMNGQNVTNGCTITMVYQPVTSGVTSVLWAFGSSASNRSELFMDHDVADDWFVRWQDDDGAAETEDLTVSPMNIGPSVLTFRLDGTVAQSLVSGVLYENGVNRGQAEMNHTPTDSTLVDQFALGALVRNAGNEVEIDNGRVGEFLVVSGAMDEADILTLHTYLTAKWGIS